jgi:glutathione S-transferase
MKLYYTPRSRAGRVRWFLEELELPYELVRIDPKAERSAEHLAAHPLGAVPAIEHEGVTLFESAAIVEYLSDLTGKLAPKPGTPERARYLQWMVCGMATLEPLVVQLTLPEEQRNAVQLEDAKKRLARWVQVLERELEGREYLLGDFSGADVVVGGVLVWASLAKLIGGTPNLDAYVARLKARPAQQRARKD